MHGMVKRTERNKEEALYQQQESQAIFVWRLVRRMLLPEKVATAKIKLR
jgi:hypothetical protein